MLTPSVLPDTAMQDTVLAPDIQPSGAARHAADCNAILLTGATGFLGVHLLADLHRYTNATIYCLVRASGEDAAAARLRAKLSEFGFGDIAAALQPRILPVPGDLALPRLGMEPGVYAHIVEEVGAIFSNAAKLNHISPYDGLRDENVGGTVEVLRLAGAGTPKWIYYVSSMIAATERDQNGDLAERFPRMEPTALMGGYAQSKWVAEKLLAEARRRGLGVTVFRPGIISGRQDTGAWPAQYDHLMILLKGSAQVGCAFDSGVPVDVTPVEFVSEALVRIALEGPDDEAIQLSNPNSVPWTRLVAWMNEMGYPMETLPLDEWRVRLARRISRNSLFPLRGIYLDPEATNQFLEMMGKLWCVNRESTSRWLGKLGMAYPKVELPLWRSYVARWREHRYFPAPRVECVK